jgi:eukaryotic-like serine/threonine-protein kinase
MAPTGPDPEDRASTDAADPVARPSEPATVDSRPIGALGAARAKPGDSKRPPSRELDDTMLASAERMAAKLAEAATPEALTLTPGSTIRDRYRIERVMAEGGNGVILRAEDRELARAVAIKVLTPSAARDANLRARFKLEARHAVRLKSEHVSKVYDVGELDDGTQYIVLELLEGEDLATLLSSEGRLDPTHAVDLVLQACEALAEAHHHGIVHRDIKLANLFLARRADASPILKVIDFGLSKRAAAGSVASGLTQGLAVGTPRNMAPEQVMATDAQDHRLDVWALGTVLYELLTGISPFDGPTLQAVFAKVLVGEPAPLATLRPELPAELIAVIESCLVKDPTLRLGSIAELATGLLPFASADGRTAGERATRVGAPVPERISGAHPAASPSTAMTATSARTAITPPARPRVASVAEVSSTAPPPSAGGRSRLLLVGGGMVAAAAIVAAIVITRGGGGERKGAARPAPPSSPALALGASCERDDQCGARSCLRGLCTVRCQADADCELPSTCVENTCTLPLQVGFLHYGVPEDDGWTRAHEDARIEVMKRLPYVHSAIVTDTDQLDEAERGIDRLIADGAKVVIATSSSHLPAVRGKLLQYPNITFVNVATGPPETGMGMVDSRLEDASYLAGIAAARATRTKRLGFIGPQLHAQPIRFANAFLHGARQVDPTIELEIRWLGSWFDATPADAQGRHLEERLTQQLIDAGCDVIAHNVDSARVVNEIERQAKAGRPVFAIANNTVEQCDGAPTSCLGTTTRQWASVYAHLLDSIHRGTYRPGQLQVDGIQVDAAQSAVAFEPSRTLISPETRSELGRALAALDRPGATLFTGPFCWVGEPRECVAAGATITDDRRWAMCRFFDGVIEPIDPSKPRAGTRPAQVPSGCGR